MTTEYYEPYKKHAEIRSGRWTGDQELVIHTSDTQITTIDMTDDELCSVADAIYRHFNE
jgi:phenolic acid decarboxylase